MELKQFLEGLPALSLSPGIEILADSTEPRFKDALARWTDMDKKEPGALIFPTTEEDTVKIVKYALTSSIPFVAKAGGHSSWSTIGPEGFVLDFSRFRDVTVDVDASTATASAGTLVGEINQVVSDKGFLVATGTVNSVGFIPSTIGGGLTILAPVIGYGSDNIVSARLITAKGDLITVSDTENSELLYAIKGAGQFFGVITSLTVKIYPLSLLGTPAGIVWNATFVFDVSKTAEVAKAVLEIKRNAPLSYSLGGVFPGPSIMVVVGYLGSKSEGEKVFKALIDIGPTAVPADAEVPIGELNNAFVAFEAKGGLKRWYAPGVPSVDQFTPEHLQYLVAQKTKIDTAYPAAAASTFVIEFTSGGPFNQVTPCKETAFAHRDLAMFVHLIIQAADQESFDGANKIAEESVAHLREVQTKEQYSFYQNFSRTAPIGERYRGSERLEKLKDLKQKWDPEGIFTAQLL